MFWTLELASHLEDAPYLIVVFEQAYGLKKDEEGNEVKKKALKTSGPIIQARKISFLMKMNINTRG